VEGDGNHRGFVELPYTLPQDHTLFVLLRARNNEVWKTKVDWIARKGGMALMDVHPCYTNPDGDVWGRDSYPLTVYADFLRHVRDHYAGRFWHALPADVSRFCRDNRNSIATRTLRRVCMMAYAFYDTDNRIIRYAETLARRGDEVDVISLRRPGQVSEETVNGVHVMRIQERQRNERFAVHYLWRMLRFLIGSARVLTHRHRNEPYDLVHVHSVPDFEVFAAWWAKRTGARVILDIHDIVPEFYASKFKIGSQSLFFRLLIYIERKSTAFADHVIIANHLWRKKLVERCVPSEKCLVVLNYIDTDTFARRARRRNDGRFIIVYPGGLQWHQGLDVAVRALGRVRLALPNTELHIYGEGSEKNRIQSLVEELGLEGSISLHSVVPHREVAQVIADADLGIVPKRADSFGNEAYSTKILEFMSQGVPVLASRTRIDSYYFQEPAVRFFESGNDADMAEKMIEIAIDERLRQSMVQRADRYLVENGWSRRKQEYLNLVGTMTDHPEAQVVDP
jgi:glycosyltransferase involved in cell wall biosynthesis